MCLTTEYRHPIQQLYFLLKGFEANPLSKVYSHQPINDLLKAFAAQKDDMSFTFLMPEGADMETFNDLYFGEQLHVEA